MSGTNKLPMGTSSEEGRSIAATPWSVPSQTATPASSASRRPCFALAFHFIRDHQAVLPGGRLWPRRLAGTAEGRSPARREDLRNALVLLRRSFGRLIGRLG